MTRRAGPPSTATACGDTADLAAGGLRYSSDQRPGIRRIRSRSSFRYHDDRRGSVRDKAVLQRIRTLAIPPAWTEVWISPDPRSHLQATGRDARNRKQYRYHPDFRQLRDEDKYSRMIAFGKALPRIRSHVRRAMRARGLGREKVLAAVVRLLELTSIRVGNEKYAEQNRSYGLTTLQDRHATTRGSTTRLRFRGKSGKTHDIEVDHPILARIVRRCRDLPGQDLFQYVDGEGVTRDVTSDDVNAYLREITGQDFTAKDFRTWTGTVLAALALREFEEPSERTRKSMVRAIEQVAARLGNTPSVCRKCYIHPVILDSFLDGTLVAALRRQTDREVRTRLRQFSPEEAAVMTLLRQKLRESQATLESKLRRSIRKRRRAGPRG